MEYTIMKYMDNGAGDNIVGVINALIADGWMPQGGLVVVNQKNDSIAGRNTMYQAMTRDK